MTNTRIPEILQRLFRKLLQRGFALGPTDYASVRQALRFGYGLESPNDLLGLLSALWAKSRSEQQILKALFEQYRLDTWELPTLAKPAPKIDETKPETSAKVTEDEAEPENPLPLLMPMPETPSGATIATLPESREGLPAISLVAAGISSYSFIFVPQYSLAYREIAQAWRRLRQPVRQGPPIELDVKGTVARCARRGTVTDVVLVPRRRNAARLLLLIDCKGSMTPYQDFVDQIRNAIFDAGTLSHAACYYFHDAPMAKADKRLLHHLGGELFPALDSLLPRIQPAVDGLLYKDSNLTRSIKISQVLEKDVEKSCVVIVSDGGAARGNYDLARMLETITFVKALLKRTNRIVWLNPVVPAMWKNSTAEQLARHIPMFHIDRPGMYAAIEILRGHPFHLERPL